MIDKHLGKSYKIPVFFSGKITHSFYVHLLRQGVEASEIYELTDLPEEFLKDPTSWLDAKKVELFLQALEERFSLRFTDVDLISSVGHISKELKAWGVLDSVLRMIERPQDVFTQPQRFISYFISPSPPIANFQRSADGVSFDLPISYEEYPNVCTYLTSAIESLPSFMGGELAEAKWEQTKVSVKWRQEQESFTGGELQKRVLAPQFMENLIETLERTERALEEKSRELEGIKRENTAAAQSQSQDLEKWFNLYRNFNRYSQQVLRLHDYFTRSKQLITLLVGQDRSSPQVKKAMQVMNWEQIQTQFPEIVDSLVQDFEAEQKGLKPEKNNNVQDQQDPRPGSPGQSWLSHS